MRLYLDASVIVPYIVPEDNSALITRYIMDHVDELLISSLALGECLSAISIRRRRRELPADDAELLADVLQDWSETIEPIEVEAADVSLAANFVRRFDLGLRMPDAIHAAACHRLGLTLVTFDKALARAAQALGVATETLA